ncbi:MAG: DUF2092 domain-containing protein [Pseudomonadota bacterium]
MTGFRRARLAAAMLLGVPGLALAEADDRLDPVAMEIAKESAEFLTQQPILSFDWFVSFDEVIEGREKVTFVRSGSNLLVRDQGFFGVAERGSGVREYYYDGAEFTVAAPQEGFYATAPFPDGFEALLDAVRNRTGAHVPVWTLMSAELGKTAVEDLDGAAYLGTTLVAGREAHHLAFTEYDEDWQLWISTDPEQPVPIMLVSTDPHQQGWPQYRAHMLNWTFEAPEDAVFTFEPHEDDVKATMPSLVPTERERIHGGARAEGEGAQ